MVFHILEREWGNGFDLLPLRFFRNFFSGMTETVLCFLSYLSKARFTEQLQNPASSKRKRTKMAISIVPGEHGLGAKMTIDKEGFRRLVRYASLVRRGGAGPARRGYHHVGGNAEARSYTIVDRVIGQAASWGAQRVITFLVQLSVDPQDTRALDNFREAVREELGATAIAEINARLPILINN